MLLPFLLGDPGNILLLILARLPILALLIMLALFFGLLPAATVASDSASAALSTCVVQDTSPEPLPISSVARSAVIR